jgi:hypothetical protein
MATTAIGHALAFHSVWVVPLRFQLNGGEGVSRHTSSQTQAPVIASLKVVL